MIFETCKKRLLALTVSVVILGFASCSPHFQSRTPISHAESKPTLTIDPDALCETLVKIKSIPFKDEPVDDPAYNNLMAAGEKVVPCLIRKITDTTVMPDPRSAPRYVGIDNKVGDVALWVLCDITSLSFIQFLPPNVQEEYKEEGVLAYFEYVQTKENRQELQRKLEQWYREKYGHDASNP